MSHLWLMNTTEITLHTLKIFIVLDSEHYVYIHDSEMGSGLSNLQVHDIDIVQ